MKKNFLPWIFISLSALFVLAQCKKNQQDNTPDKTSLSPEEYLSKLGKGMDVDWSKTALGATTYNEQMVRDFKNKGFSHVRLRIKDDVSADLLNQLDKQINDCLNDTLIPIIAYQADDFKNLPSEDNLMKVVDWWQTVAEHYKTYSSLLAFDLIIEVTDSLNKRQDVLNEVYEKAVGAIRASNPQRLIFISPIYRSDPTYLNGLVIPSKANGFLLGEWHFYASGPSKTKAANLWTTGTDAEKKLITDKIQSAKLWEQQTGIKTWVGAWMPGNYNDGNDYTVSEQVVFANFMSCELTKNNVPFSINSDTKYYDASTNQWISNMLPVVNEVLMPKNCQ